MLTVDFISPNRAIRGIAMAEQWDDAGAFEDEADRLVGEVDLIERNPFDLSKALEGAALDELNPSVKKFE